MFYLMSQPGQKVGRFVGGLGLGLRRLGFCWSEWCLGGLRLGWRLGGFGWRLGSIRGIFNFALLKVT